jgi:hypothetical protein
VGRLNTIWIHKLAGASARKTISIPRPTAYRAPMFFGCRLNVAICRSIEVAAVHSHVDSAVAGHDEGMADVGNAGDSQDVAGRFSIGRHDGDFLRDLDVG